MRKASETDHAASHVELTFQDTLNRADLWNMAVSELRRRRYIYQDQILAFLGSLKICVRKIYIHGQKVPSAAFSDSTKPVFRSESARFTIAMQMSREMWEFDADRSGEIVLTKGYQFLGQLFDRWEKLNCRHILTLMLFSRVAYEDDAGPDSPRPSPNHVTQPKQAFKDFYRVVVSETLSSESQTILQKLKKECKEFLRDVESMPLHGGSAVHGEPTGSRNGNFLEAISLSTTAYLKDDIDSDFLRTGTSIVVITPGTAVFEVDENLLRLTTQNMLTRAFDMDLVCLSQVPLHSTPLFLVPQKEVPRTRLTSLASRDSDVAAPPWPCKSKEYKPPLEMHPGILSPTMPCAGSSNSKRFTSKYEVDYDFVVPSWIEVSFYHGDKRSLALEYDDSQPKPAPRSRMVSSEGTKPIHQRPDFDVPFLSISQEKGEQSPTASRARERGHIRRDPDISRTMSQKAASNESSARLAGKDPPNLESLTWMDEYDRNAFKVSPNVPGGSKNLSVKSKATPAVDNDPYGRTAVEQSPAPRELPVHSISTFRKENTYDSLAGNAPSRPTLTHLNESSVPVELAPKKLSAKTSLNSLLQGHVYGKAAPATISRPEAAKSSPSFSKEAQQQLEEKPSRDEGKLCSSQIRASLSRVVSSKVSSPKLNTPDPSLIKTTPVPSSLREDSWKPSPSFQSNFGTDRVSAIRAAPKSKNAHFESIESLGQRPPMAERFSSNRLLPWMVLSNPSKPGDSMKLSFGHWNHAFVRCLEPSTVKWRALSAPASLPLTTEHFPTPDQLHTEFTEHPYEIAISEVEPAAIASARAHLAREVVQCRLSEGFQIAVGKGTSEVTGRPAARFMDLFEDDFMTEDGATLLLLRGDDVQLLCAAADEISVTRYHRRSSAPRPLDYQVMMRTHLESEYRQCTLPLSIFPDTNWNAVDHYIASHEYGVTELPAQNVFAGLNPRRVRFVLVPVEPPASARAGGDSDEEIRTEGIRKLTMLWQKFRYTSPEEARFRAAWEGHRDPNPLAIEYQTRDPAAVVTAGLESTLLVEGEATAAQTQLFNESDTHRTSHVDLSRLAADLQGENGIKLRDRRWHFRLYHYCLVGADLTSFLLANFADLKSREEAVEFGNVLMQKGLFEHVHDKHRFRDGNFYYTLAKSHRLAKPSDSKSPAAWFAPRSSVPATPASESSKELSADAGSKRPKVRLSATLPFNVDPRKLSDRLEIVTIHYDRLHNPANAFHFHIEWTNATARLIEDSLVSWAMQVERHGLKLVQLPLTEACTVNATNPFRMPHIVELAAKPPAPPAVSNMPTVRSADSPALAARSTSASSGPDENHYLKALLRKLDFVLDFEAADAFPADVDVSYSWGGPDFAHTQFIHRSGTLLAQILPGARLLLLANRLCHSRTTVAARNPRPQRPGTGGGAAALAGMAGAVRVKEEVEAFCRDERALRAFYEDVAHAYALAGYAASERGTPALSATRSAGGGAAAMPGVLGMDASIPSLELQQEEGWALDEGPREGGRPGHESGGRRSGRPCGEEAARDDVKRAIDVPWGSAKRKSDGS